MTRASTEVQSQREALARAKARMAALEAAVKSGVVRKDLQPLLQVRAAYEPCVSHLECALTCFGRQVSEFQHREGE